MKNFANRTLLCTVILAGAFAAYRVFAAANESSRSNSPSTGVPPPTGIDRHALERIEQAIPQVAPAVPKKPRKLLIFDLNVGYGGHPSAAYANHAFKLMGERTGAFQTVISRDPAVFAPDSLRQFDAVFFNNTVGNLFTDPELRESLVRFVYRGGGMLGVHGTSVAFTQWPGAIEDWPEFGLMIGARGANHRESTEHVYVKLDDPDNPLNSVFEGRGFEYRDEFFRVHDPYSRRRVRVLFSIDTERTDLRQGRGFGNLERADNDYALAWVRNYGRGRTFYCTIAHNPYVFWDPMMLRFYLGAIQFALGDLPAPTIPSEIATPAIRAREKLGWRVAAHGTQQMPVFDSIDEAARLGLAYIAVSSTQALSPAVPKPLDSRLETSEMRQLRFKLDYAGLRILSYEIVNAPKSEPEWKRAFGLARDLGAEFVVAAPDPSLLETLQQLCREFGLFLVAKPSENRETNVYARAQSAADATRRYAPWIGFTLDPEGVVGGASDYSAVLGGLAGATIAVKCDRTTRLGQFLEEMHKAKVRPALLLVPLGQPENAAPLVETINRASLQIISAHSSTP
ncbi:MAG: ThuA domain-containing protein [Verrucomicrobiota bacterium]|nr:ThuA domain-containing protein [Verrucomicrobiota bacterium]